MLTAKRSVATAVRERPRPEADTPSTLGGPGWVPREGSHLDDVRAGRLWTCCGYRSEVARLRAVALAWPPAGLACIEDGRAALMMGRVHLGRIRAQAEGVADAFRRHDVEVLFARPSDEAPPNVIFMRDLFLMTPAGAVIGRMASAQRAGEERYAAAALAQAGYPILATVSGAATFEGADALWIDEGTVLVGVGFRTNSSAVSALRGILTEVGAEVVTTRLGPGVQHLLGALAVLDEQLAAVHGGAATEHLRTVLRSRGYRLVELPPDEELLARRGMNMVTLAPGQVLMPAGAPGVRHRLEAVGVAVDEVDIDQYLAAAGGVACLTGILWRQG